MISILQKCEESMRKIYLFFTIVAIAVLTSCSEQMNDEKDVVKIWWFKEEGNTIYNNIVEATINMIVSCAELNDIEIDIRQFLYSDLSYDDYVLKRNLAIEQGDLDMTIDTSGNLYNLKGKASSYNRIKSYENVFDNLKNQYCIPLCMDMRVNFVNNDALMKYNIQPKNLITFDEYCEIKQRMKEAGAEFKLNDAEFDELVEYYYRKNDLKILKGDKGLSIDKKAVLTAVCNIVDDIKTNYDYDYFIKNPKDGEYKIIDQKSGYELSCMQYKYFALSYNDLSSSRPSIENYTTVLWDNNYFKYISSKSIIPCLFISKNSKSNNVYTIADKLLSDEFQILLYNSNYVGVITNSDRVRESIGFDENWNYVGVKNITDEQKKDSPKIYPSEEEERLYEVLTKGYEIIRKSDMSYFFYSIYYLKLNEFVINIVTVAIKDEKILENFDKMADDFIINLNIRQ